MTMRPSQFYWVAIVMILAAFSLPMQAMWLYGHGFSEWSSGFAKMTTLNWILFCLLCLGAYLSLQASRILIVFAPLFLAVVVINNYRVGQYGVDFAMWQTTLASLGASLLFAPFFLPSSLALLRDPNRRWWRVSRRYKQKVSTTLNPFVGGMIQAQTFDLSASGAFVVLDEKDYSHAPRVGEKIRLIFNINPMKKIRCEAVVVRVAEPNGHYPRGLGLKFVEFEKNHQKSYQQFLDQQP